MSVSIQEQVSRQELEIQVWGSKQSRARNTNSGSLVAFGACGQEEIIRERVWYEKKRGSG